MKTSLETLTGLKRSLTVELPIDTFNQKVDQVLKKMAPKVNIDGFRKGKVPMSILRQRFGTSASTDAANEVVNETLGDAFKAEKVAPAGQPALTQVDSQGDKQFLYTVEFEVFPEVKVGDFAKLKIEQTKVKITKADEDKTLEGLKEQMTEYKPVKRKSKKGDRLKVDFKGLVDGKVFEGGEAADFRFVLGSSTMIKGFEDGLTDLAAGKTTTLDLKFPDDYNAPQLAGKDVVFEISVKEVGSPKEPKVDDEFAKKFGEDNVEALLKNMKERMRIEIDNRLSQGNRDAVFNALLEANDFEVPESSIAAEAENLKQDMEARMQQQGLDTKGGNLDASVFNKEAKRRVQLGLLVNQIASDNDIEATKEQLDEQLEEMAASYGEQAQQVINYYNEDPSRMTGIELMVVEKMVQALILEKAKVTEKNKKFQEVANQQG